MIEGALTLTTCTLLAPHLTDENQRALLHAARHKSKREVEAQLAALRPLPPIAASIRKTPERKLIAQPAVPLLGARDEPGGPPAPPARPVELPRPVQPSVVKPLAPEHYKIQFTMSRDTHEKLRRAQDLLRHSIPDGDPAKIFDRALTLLLADVEKRKLAAAAKPRANVHGERRETRHIPASVRRAVWKRDEGRCAFVGTTGRCGERGFLEFHHREPFARGGVSTANNLELRCRAHNAYEAELFFGPLLAREDRAEYEPNSFRTELDRGR